MFHIELAFSRQRSCTSQAFSPSESSFEPIRNVTIRESRLHNSAHSSDLDAVIDRFRNCTNNCLRREISTSTRCTSSSICFSAIFLIVSPSFCFSLPQFVVQFSMSYLMFFTFFSYIKYVLPFAAISLHH